MVDVTIYGSTMDPMGEEYVTRKYIHTIWLFDIAMENPL